MAMTVLLGDGIEGLNSLEPGSVGMILSDLPSGETRASFDRKVNLAALWPVVWRALRPNGMCVLMASSLAFAAEVRASQLDAYHYERIWLASAVGREEILLQTSLGGIIGSQ
jgi:hypothetical protein